MKRNIYAITVVLLIIAAAVVFPNNSNRKTSEEVFFPLKKRPGPIAITEEGKMVQRQFDQLMKVVGTNPDDIKSRIALSSLFIQEARITGNHLYYDRAAMKYINEVLKKDSMHFEALVLKAVIAMSRHQFSEALAIAEKARAINPDNAFVHGILVDGHVESGNYAAAVNEADIMMSLRPDLRSYSRVSYLREIHGDYPGSIEAMKLAVDAGAPGEEATEWCRVQLGKLYEITGDLNNAEMHYQIALQERPGYAYALAGKGRIALASKEYQKAIADFRRADASLNDYSFKEELADAFELSGERSKADSVIKWLLNEMNEHAHDAGKNDHGHNSNLELASLYERAGDYDEALEHAMIEHERRPLNIQVNETLAWAYYNKKEYDKALEYLETAMKTKSQNPVLLCRAGLIYAKTKNKEKAKLLLGELMNGNYSIPLPLKQLGLQELQTL